jgi:hypothetical protein
MPKELKVARDYFLPFPNCSQSTNKQLGPL